MLGLAAVLITLAAEPKAPPSVAVAQLRALGAAPEKAELVAQVVASELAGRDLKVISSAEISGLIGLERQKQLLGCSADTSCLAEIGAGLGVDYLVLGSLGRLGERYRLDLSLLEVSSGRVAGRQAREVGVSTEGELLTVATEAARELANIIRPQVAVAKRSSLPSYLLFGGAAVTAVVGAVFGVRSLDAWSAHKLAIANGDADGYMTAVATKNFSSAAADVFITCAFVFAAAGLILLLVSR